MDKQELGLLVVYGKGLPDSGVPFLAPMKNGDVLKVKEAMRSCAARWPNKDKRVVYKDRYATGDLSSETTSENIEMVMSSKVWIGKKYRWDDIKNEFVLIDEQ